MRGILLRREGGAQFLRRHASNITQHRHDQPVRRIDRNREIDVVEKHARIGRGIVPGVEAGSAATAAIIARISRSM